MGIVFLDKQAHLCQHYPPKSKFLSSPLYGEFDSLFFSSLAHLSYTADVFATPFGMRATISQRSIGQRKGDNLMDEKNPTTDVDPDKAPPDNWTEQAVNSAAGWISQYLKGRLKKQMIDCRKYFGGEDPGFFDRVLAIGGSAESRAAQRFRWIKDGVTYLAKDGSRVISILNKDWRQYMYRVRKVHGWETRDKVYTAAKAGPGPFYIYILTKFRLAFKSAESARVDSQSPSQSWHQAGLDNQFLWSSPERWGDINTWLMRLALGRDECLPPIKEKVRLNY